jgi:hypothetical protein
MQFLFFSTVVLLKDIPKMQAAYAASEAASTSSTPATAADLPWMMFFLSFV